MHSNQTPNVSFKPFYFGHRECVDVDHRKKHRLTNGKNIRRKEHISAWPSSPSSLQETDRETYSTAQTSDSFYAVRVLRYAAQSLTQSISGSSSRRWPSDPRASLWPAREQQTLEHRPNNLTQSQTRKCERCDVRGAITFIFIRFATASLRRVSAAARRKRRMDA